MRLYIADVTVTDAETNAPKTRHIVRATVNELVSALPANHDPACVRVENRRPTVSERQQLWSAEQSKPGTFTTTVEQALDRERRAR